jgi:hypothetical protein
MRKLKMFTESKNKTAFLFYSVEEENHSNQYEDDDG